MKRRLKRISVLLCVAMLFTLNIAECLAVYYPSRDWGVTWTDGTTTGEAYYGADYAWANTTCYKEHRYLDATVKVRFLLGDTVIYDESSNSDSTTVDAYYGKVNCHMLGVIGDHFVLYGSGISSTGHTVDGAWLYNNEG